MSTCEGWSEDLLKSLKSMILQSLGLAGSQMRRVKSSDMDAKPVSVVVARKRKTLETSFGPLLKCEREMSVGCSRKAVFSDILMSLRDQRLLSGQFEQFSGPQQRSEALSVVAARQRHQRRVEDGADSGDEGQQVDLFELEVVRVEHHDARLLVADEHAAVRGSY